MGAPKPQIVVFTGAWHRHTAMDSFVQRLQEAGFPAEAHALRTAGNPEASINDDETYIRATLTSHIEEGKDVVLIAHSLAGFGSTGAIHSLDKESFRAKGLAGGLIGVIYLAAFIPTAEQSASTLFGEEEGAPMPAGLSFDVRSDEVYIWGKRLTIFRLNQD